jgi:hypothetical protein
MRGIFIRPNAYFNFNPPIGGPLFRGGMIVKVIKPSKILIFNGKMGITLKSRCQNSASFYLTLDVVMLKRFLLRSMMNGVGVNKTDCPKENKMTFSVPARSKTSHVLPFEQA